MQKKENAVEHDEVEDLVSEIRSTHGQTMPPVDVLHIAQEEGIILAPGNYGEEFDGRIEFHPRKNKFILFYPGNNKNRSNTRIRFSVTHELGHYYISEHRKLLTQGRSHYSKSGFVCDNELEHEADFFAAALLIPKKTLKEFCARKKFYTLNELMELANTWQASLTSAAIRYAQWTSECCAIVLSQNGKVLFYLPSDDAECRWFKWLGRKNVAPRSATLEAGKNQGSAKVFEQKSHTEMWFSDRRASCKLWEEAFPLGYTDLVLTMLTFEIEDE
jgi:hypothetical protein